MKNILLALGMVVGLSGCQSLGGGKSSSTGFKPMSYTEEKLANGLGIIWIADNKLPSFSARIMIGAGSAMEGSAQPGTASIVASLLDKGTSKKSATQIANELEQLGLSFGASSDEDYTTVGVEGLSLYTKEATEQLFSLLTDSKFSEGEVSRQKSLTKSQLSKVLDRPSNVASLAVDKALYGFDGHPYGRTPTLSGISKIKRADLLQFYKKWYQPQYSYMAIVGRYTPEDQDRIRTLFGSWKGSKETLPAIPVPKAPKPGVLFVQKSGLKQAEIRIVHLGIPRNNPDYLKLRVANTILGESFIGRLFSEIRVKRGLTYSIYSYFDSRETDGPFVIGTFTRLDKVTEMIQETLNVYRNFTSGVTDQEVKDAVSYLRGSFPQVIETGSDLARQILILKRYGVDPNYLATFMTEISKITPTEVNAVIKSHFKPADAVIVVYGPPGAELGLEKFGPVQRIKDTDLIK